MGRYDGKYDNDIEIGISNVPTLNMREDPNLLRKAAKYLIRWRDA